MTKAVAPLLRTDAYKLDHRRQYPDNTEYVFSNYTNRGSRIEGIDKVVHFGLQAFLVELTEAFKPFFEGDIDVIAEEYTAKVNSILGPNTIGDKHIRALHALGYLPIKFYGLPEGTRVPIRVPSFTFTNTHPAFGWLPNYLETWISQAVWQPSTSATLAYEFQQLLRFWALKTTGSYAGVEFQGHDFSARGMAGPEAAAASGAGHLLSFQGSDTLEVIEYVETHYTDPDAWVLASVPATEHSVMCAGGKNSEKETFERLLDLYPSGIVSVVSDTWDLWKVLTELLPSIKDQILARDGKLVIRPDSGNPVDIITGTQAEEWANGSTYEKIKVNRKFGQGTTPEEKGVIEVLWDVFGGTVNERGYKVLDSHIGAIYGDSITFDRAREIMIRLEAKGFASTNIVFGVGSFTYQYQTRDTFGSAIKATWVQIAGEEEFIWKDPATDNGLKKSAKGRIAVLSQNGELYLKDELTYDDWKSIDGDLLQLVWENGTFYQYSTFTQVRERLAETGAF